MSLLSNLAMRGGGFYNLNSSIQNRAMRATLPLLKTVVQPLAPLPTSSQPVYVADYGCSQGRNSIEPLRCVLDEFWRRKPDLDVIVLHTDLPSNDFESLFRLVYSQNPEESLVAFNGEHPRQGRAYCYVAGRSFYEQLAPDGFVTFGWSGIAFHYLSRLPDQLTTSSAPNRTTGSELEEVRQIAASDWHSLLSLRCRELKVGGRLLCTQPGRAGDDKSIYARLIESFDRHCGRLLSSEERQRLMVPQYYRTLSEAMAPFDANSEFHSDTGGRRLKLLHADVQEIRNCFAEQLESNGDRDEFAAAVANFWRSLTQSQLDYALSSNEESEAISENIFSCVIADLKADPTIFLAAMPLLRVAVERVA
eukprot:NODE_1864_length_1375_cov_42.860483_g1686_i0.p1 GENE.NODE_1864_length_1375_cov_42.860483_g1686_i0~~NODE_1864_length_1375_cov_42.860483_g1686_i0.p1  ORF type:complete len:402 (+),score=84.40 NODE_1864_length_1375_cov_42.860483_g1686_i0:117-1208(+)